jgi:hypothetical protein
MSADDYKDFVATRATGLLHKGRKALGRWLGAPKELTSNKILIELVALIAKCTLRRVIEEAIRLRSPFGKLHIISSPLTVAEIQSLMAAQKDSLKANVDKVLMDCEG